jgi:hypothetical protein
MAFSAALLEPSALATTSTSCPLFIKNLLLDWNYWG